MTAEAELHQLVAHLFATIEEERGKVAHILHDELGQALTVAKIELHGARRRIAADAPGVEPQLASIASAIDEAMRTVRKLSADLRPGVLEDLGLEAAVEWQLDRLAESPGVRCHMTASLDEQVISPAQAIAAFRILQEILAHAIIQPRTAQSPITIGVSMLTDKRQLAMEITMQAEDGRDVGEMPELLSLSIQERARLMGGRVFVQRGAGAGTRVNLVLPHAAIEGARHDQGLDSR